MTMRPRYIPDVPEETAKIAKAAFRKGSVYMQMRDELGTLYEDKQFQDLFPQVGRLAMEPWRLALVTVMQFAENLTDRQAADAVRGRIDWKYALSLELADEGFDFSVLSEFRGRLLTNQAESRLFELLLKHFSERGLLKTNGKQRTDATYVLGSVRNLNRLEFIGETLRAALNALAEQEAEWLLSFMPREWFERYGRPFTSWRLPRKAAEVEVLAQQIGEDGIYLLSQVDLATSPLRIRQIPEVEILRQIWQQQFYQEDEKTLWRKETDLPSPAMRFVSPYDMDVRSGYKGSGHQWRGYKVHYTETCEEDSPNLITDVQTTSAAEPDLHTLAKIQASLAENNRLPQTQFADGGYTMAPNLVSSQRDYGIELIGPVRDDPSWQRKENTGFDIGNFQIDFETKTAICPQGHLNRSWKIRPKDQQNYVWAAFSVKVCRPCPVRELCCRSKNPNAGRTICFQAEEEFLALHQRRAWQQTPDFWLTYNRRAGIEGTMFQASIHGVRESRYRGLEKTNFQHWMIATAINLLRVLAWLAEIPRAKTKPSSLTRLANASF